MKLSDKKPQDLFMDKMGVSASVIIKEGELVSRFSELMFKFNQGYMNEEEVYTSEDYGRCWQYAHQIYLWLEKNKVKEYFKKKDSESNTFKKMKNIKNKYESFEDHVTIDDLKFFIDNIRDVITWAGYHKDERDNQVDDVLEPMEEWS